MEYKKALKIVTDNPNLFLKTEHIEEGYTMVSFNYSKEGVKYEDFLENDAFELRGLTFVLEQGNVVDIFPMLHKFFNYGEIPVEPTSEIESIHIKDDGSLVGFIVLPNGKVIPKTKTGFSNEFTEIARKWLEKNENERMIVELNRKEIVPLFEAVSFNHQIVLKYNVEDLKFIQARRKNLEYLTSKELSLIASSNRWLFESIIYDNTLKDLLSLKKDRKDIEGFIVRFKDGLFMKVKTEWYFEQHAQNESMKRLNFILGEYFKSGRKTFEEDLETKFIQDFERTIAPEVKVKTLLELKAFFRDSEDERLKSKYQQLYRTFIKDYGRLTDYSRENTLIKLTLEGRLDDILPILNPEQKEKALDVRGLVQRYLDSSINSINEILKEELSFKELNTKYRGTPFLGIVIKSIKTEKSVKDIFIENTLKNTKRLQNARTFLNKIKSIS